MTAPLVSNFKSRFSFIRSCGVFALGMSGIAAGLSGCLAASLAPMAIQGLGFGVEAAGTMVAHGGDKSADESDLDDETSFSDSDFERAKSSNRNQENKCNELVLITPAIIQFRTARAGSSEWRELGLGGSADAPRWTVVAASDTPTAKDLASGGWSPANNLGHMNFTPPFKTSLTPGDESYLAYAPALSYSASERDQLASLVLDFGPVVGTFDYKGRRYKYATVKELPCFPVPE
jgi:hypothetical protein